MNSFHRWFLTALTVFAAADPGVAAEYRLDLTDAVGPSGTCFGDCGFDLGMQFSRIDSAELFVRGTFTPGLWVPGNFVPTELHPEPTETSFDTVRWGLMLGEDARTWMGNLGLGLQFNGVNGAFEELLEFSPHASNTPALLPSLVHTPANPENFEFLHHGQGVVHAMWLYPSNVMMTTREPVLHFDEIALILHGVAVPEPSSLALCALLLTTLGYRGAKRSKHFQRCFLAGLACFGVVTPGFAAEHRFDLTYLLGASATCQGDCEFDLGTQFSQIDSADLLIRGLFEPRNLFPVTVIGERGESSIGVLEDPSVQVKSWVVSLDDKADGWPGLIGNSASFLGVDGEFELLLPLGKTQVFELDYTVVVGPAEFPVAPTDLEFLHDGKGVLNAFDLSAPSILRFDEITLVLNGVAIPEPSSLVMGSLLLLASVGLRPCRAFLR